MRRALFGLVAVVALGGVLLLGTGQQARANGVPQLVKLTYLDGISNWGPKDAEGVLEFSFAEAYARIEVKNLPPAEGYTYDGWLTGGAAAPLYVGPIPVQPSGVGSVETKLQGLASYDYSLFVVTARADGTDTQAMPQEKSIAGRFAVINDETPGAENGDTRPSTLPNAGEPEPGGGLPWRRIGFTAGAMAVAATGLGIALRFARGRKTDD